MSIQGQTTEHRDNSRKGYSHIIKHHGSEQGTKIFSQLASWRDCEYVYTLDVMLLDRKDFEGKKNRRDLGDRALC